MLRLLLLTILVALLLGTTAKAEDADPAKLNAEVIRLYKAGKYAEAILHAERLLKLSETALGPDHPDVATPLNNLAALYESQGRYGAAKPLYQRSLKIFETALGPDHPDVANSLNNLAELYRAQGRYGAAKPLYQRSLKIYETALGPDHPDVATTLNNLAALYESQGRHGAAKPLYQRSLKIYETALGPDHPDVATALNNLAGLFDTQGRHGAAKPLYQRSLKIYETVLGPDHPYVATALNNLAGLYASQGLYGEAEPLYQRSLKIYETALGPDHPDVASTLNNLAVLFRAQGRYGEAEPFFKRTLKIYETALGPDHPYVATILNNLAELFRAQGRYGEAEPFFKRSLKIRETALGPDHPYVATALNNLAGLYDSQGLYGEAEPFYKRSLKVRETALGPDHPDVASTLNNLAVLFRAQGRYGEAEPFFKRSLKIYEAALGPDHPYVGTALNNLAGLYDSQGLYGEAEPFYKRSLKIRETALGPDHPDVAGSLNNLAFLAFGQKDWSTAAQHWRGATDVLIRRTRRGGILGQKLTGKKKSEVAQRDWYFRGFVKSVYRDKTATKDSREGGEAMFPIAQWALGSDAAGALAKMSARTAANNTALGNLIRERQDLVNEWQKRDQARSQFASLHPNKRDKKQETENKARLDKIDGRISTIDKQLEKDFPDYAAITNPVPLTIEQTQALLGPKEALVLFLDTETWKPTPEETFIWVVTRDEMTWARSPLGTGSLTKMVKRLRCGLDAAGWSGEKNKNAPCQDLTGRSFDLAGYYQGKAHLPFEPDVAHALYDGLFGQIKDQIKGKKLLLVPSGPLTSLPFQVLLNHKPAEGTTLQDMPWLIKDHALTVLPSVASLKALRRNAKASAAENPFLGFGNPLLLGRSGKDKSAWAKQSCKFQPRPKPLRVAGLTIPDAISKYFRGGAVNVALLKRQAPLPETADELCAVAETIGASPQAVHLGAKATEAEVKLLSKQGALQQAKILHFATHGLLADETGQLLENKAEPSLLLTPPDKATDEDDGLLTASEITQLKLDADWVILSACNTAAGDKPGAEPMSGLAKAFFYAGARALLISHWAVQSDATVALITKSFAAQKQDPSLGRAGALRSAMLSLINSNHIAHPEYWAPFIVVGEGS